MSARVDDLTQFFNDSCWLFVHLARRAPAGVIMRRGPSDWWHITSWDTATDCFHPGQWFHGRMYPQKCDVSPDGRLFIYFAGQFKPRNNAGGYSDTWIAVSRPPYLTALALWPVGDTWGGSGQFIDEKTVLVATSIHSFGGKTHPNHPAGPLEVIEYRSVPRDDPRRQAVPSWLDGWQGEVDESVTESYYPSYKTWRKRRGELLLTCDATQGIMRGGVSYGDYASGSARLRTTYLLSRGQETLGAFEAHWADWDQQGRLVATAGGRVLAAELKGNRLEWRELTALQEDRPSQVVAPDWAQHW